MMYYDHRMLMVILARRFAMLFLLVSAMPLSIQAAAIPYANIYNIVQQLYPARVHWLEHSELSLNEALTRIDPHARWLSEDHIQQYSLSGESVGVGADLLRQNTAWWIAPYQGGVLFDLGLMDRMRLLAVDGVDVQYDNSDQLLARFRGKIDTKICVTVTASSGPRTACVRRHAVQPPTIERIFSAKGQDSRIRIREFRGHQTRVELYQAIIAMQESGLPIRIDLRESSGGDLFEALDSAALFVEGGVPMVEFRAIRGENKIILAPESLPTITAPVDILIGPNTASAAEIFAGILRISADAHLVGERSYGKCTSQKGFPLADGSTLWLTNMVVYFVDGRTCEGRGLEPDNGI